MGAGPSSYHSPTSSSDSDSAVSSPSSTTTAVPALDSGSATSSSDSDSATSLSHSDSASSLSGSDSAVSSSSSTTTAVPALVVDGNKQTTYKVDKLLGTGGFGRCYELVNINNNNVYAGKAVRDLTEIQREVDIHRGLSHCNIVKLEGSFKANNNLFIILELCSQGSLAHLLKRRGRVTEVEARHFTEQIVHGVRYLHQRHIIHRDLKPDNIFLNDEIQVKLGDFGLSTRVRDKEERLTHECGTSDYMAPEIFGKAGYSFEVDIWAIGCIVYAMLVGQSPFEEEDSEETLKLIKSNTYTIPPQVGPDATALITALLAPVPTQRPCFEKILKHQFFIDGFKPNMLPRSCLIKHPGVLVINDDLSVRIAYEFLALFNFAGLRIDAALRAFLHHVSLNGETSERVQLLAHFAQRYQESNPKVFNSADEVTALTCALLLLNKDIHDKNHFAASGKKLSSRVFIDNLAHTEYQYDKTLLEELYTAVKEHPIQKAAGGAEREDEQQTARSMSADKQIHTPTTLTHTAIWPHPPGRLFNRGPGNPERGRTKEETLADKVQRLLSPGFPRSLAELAEYCETDTETIYKHVIWRDQGANFLRVGRGMYALRWSLYQLELDFFE